MRQPEEGRQRDEQDPDKNEEWKLLIRTQSGRRGCWARLISCALSAKSRDIYRRKKSCEASACNHQEGIVLKDANDQIGDGERSCCEQSE